MLQQLWNGITVGALYGVYALGYTLVFGVIQVIFFAQGELSMLAAFAALTIFRWWGPDARPTVWSSVVAVAGAFMVSVSAGLLSERFAIRPLLSRPRVRCLVASLGLSIIFQNIVMLTAGPQPIPFPTLFGTAGWSVSGVRVGIMDFVTVLTLGVLVLSLGMFLKHHRVGLAIRAVAQSGQGARLMGINRDHVVALTFVLSSSIAATAGILTAGFYGVARFNMGFVPGIKGFTVAILGGVGNIYGSAAAALLLGVCEALFAGFVSSSYRDLFVFAVLILTLGLRSKGLFGEHL